MVDLVFEDPPEYWPDADSVRKNAGREQIVAELVHHPGRWVVVSRHVSRPRASQVARNLRRQNPPPYEFRASANRAGEGVVYGRYSAPDANI